MFSDTVRFRQGITNDYQGALLRLATLRAEGEHHLLFAWLEFFPFDMSLPSGWNSGEKPWTVPGSGGWTCAVSVKRLAVADALDWYEAAAKGNINIGTTKGRPVKVLTAPLGPEPVYGRFCVEANVPFTFRWHSDPRIHRYVPLTGPPRPVRKLSGSAPARKWLEQHVGFDPYRFDEWLGGLAFVAPDPICSSVAVFPSARTAAGEETLTIYAVPRRSQERGVVDISGLTIHVGERRIGGWSSVNTFTLDATGYATIVHPQLLGEIAYAVVCPKRGLLRFFEPHSWIEQVQVGMNIGNSRLRIEVPSGGRRKPRKEIEVYRYTKGANLVVGEPLKDIIRQRLVTLRERRKSQEQRAHAPQKVFGIAGDKAITSSIEINQKKKDAEQFIGELVGAARHRVVFVDPFFGHRETRLFAFGTLTDGVVPRILTGLPGLLAGETDGSGLLAGDRLVADLENLNRDSKLRVPQVRVMPGRDSPVIHDRYLIVDDAVWHCGPSFNELGERLGIIVRLPDPLSVRRFVSKVWCRSNPLFEFWLEYRKPANEAR